MTSHYLIINEFLTGAIFLAASAIGLFFLRFYKRTGDRLFLIFAVAFWVLSLNWLALAFTEKDEVRTALYFVRFIAFMVILLGIIDKNRSSAKAK